MIEFIINNSFILSGLFLLPYPAVFVAGIMSYANKNQMESGLNKMISMSFLLFSLWYPVFYIACLILYFIFRDTNETISFILSVLPLIYLILTIILLLIWLFLDPTTNK